MEDVVWENWNTYLKVCPPRELKLVSAKTERSDSATSFLLGVWTDGLKFC